MKKATKREIAKIKETYKEMTEYTQYEVTAQPIMGRKLYVGHKKFRSLDRAIEYAETLTKKHDPRNVAILGWSGDGVDGPMDCLHLNEILLVK